MKINAVMPMNWAMAGLSKYMPPMPSEPATMPIMRNNIKVGTPSLAEVLLPKILRSNKIEAPNKIFPVEIGM
jgi:hypothetical protein